MFHCVCGWLPENCGPVCIDDRKIVPKMLTVFPKVGIFISNLQIENRELKVLPVLTK